MRDELAHIRNKSVERRRVILTQHKALLDKMYSAHPELNKNNGQIERIKKLIITKTISKLQGQALDTDINELEQQLEVLRMERLDLLEQKKIDPKLLQPNWDCSRCQDTGRIYIDDDRFEVCGCNEATKAEMLRTAVNLPVRLAKASFSNVDTKLYQPQFRKQAAKIFEYVQKYCDNIESTPGHGLFIHGPTGSGKSYLLGCIANHLFTQMPVKYLVYADFLDSLRATFNTRDNGNSEQQLIDEVKNTGLLLLDDLGVEKPTEFALKYLAQIIDYRYRNCLPIVVTSNFTQDELKNRTQNDLYGERIVWRLIEICSILNLEGNIRINL